MSEYKTLLKLCQQNKLGSILAIIATDTQGLLKDSEQSLDSYNLERLQAYDKIMKGN